MVILTHAHLTEIAAQLREMHGSVGVLAEQLFRDDVWAGPDRLRFESDLNEQVLEKLLVAANLLDTVAFVRNPHF